LAPAPSVTTYSTGSNAGRARIDLIDLLCTTEIAPPGYGADPEEYKGPFSAGKEPTIPHLSEYTEHYESPEISAARSSATSSANNPNYVVRIYDGYDSDDNIISLNIEIDVFKSPQNINNPIATPSILYDREADPGLTLDFEMFVLSNVFLNLYILALDEIKRTRTPGNEIILKNEKNEIVAREDDIFNVVEEIANVLSFILKKCNKTEPDLIETKPEPANKISKGKKSKAKTKERKGSPDRELKKLRLSLEEGLYSKYWMTEDTEYEVDKVDEYSQAINYGPINNSPSSIIFNKALEGRTLRGKWATPILLDRETIDGIVRAHYLRDIIYNLAVATVHFSRILRELQNRPEINSIGSIHLQDQQASLIIKILSTLVQLGTPNEKINKILMNAVTENRHMIEQLTRVPKKHTDESPSLRAFIRKIAMPIDISETASSSEKSVAARLRDLGRMLADKHGATYSPQPGNVVLDVLRKAEDLDEVMIDVTQAIEDCFNLINNAPLSDS
jgi:hypothetical protein